MKVLVLGASGFIGKHLVTRLKRRGDDVVEATLRDPVAAAARTAGCDAIVNLAGESVAQRWSPAVKERIRSSRVELPGRFLEALRRQNHTAKTYVSASAIGYYPTGDQAEFVEESAPGTAFLARVCQEWEEQALHFRDAGVRVALIRTGVALAIDGGALEKMLPIFRMGLGGPLGNGHQWFSWIHIDDLTGIYMAALDRGEGAFNATAPKPVTNQEFTRELAATLGRPAMLTVPRFALQALLGEAAQTVLASQRVLPKRTLEDLEYRFTFPELHEALTALLN